MANYCDRFSDNVPGAFFVDNECIACDTCVGIAAGHFALTAQNDHAYVHKQPQSELEIKACRDAMAQCPVDAIGCVSDSDKNGL